MRDIDSMYDSKYLKAHMLGGEVRTVTILRVESGHEFEGEVRPVVFFEGVPKGHPLPKVNKRRIAKLYGQDADAWVGKRIMIYPSETELKGDTVPCIRVKKEAPLPVAPAQTEQSPVATGPPQEQQPVKAVPPEPPATVASIPPPQDLWPE